jgi:hypothetical protein
MRPLSSVWIGGAVGGGLEGGSGDLEPVVGEQSCPAHHGSRPGRRIILDSLESNAYRVMVGRDAQSHGRPVPRRAAALIAGKMKDLLG